MVVGRWFVARVIVWLVKKLTKLSENNFAQVVEWVKEAEVAISDGKRRARWVQKQITKVLEVTSPFIANIATELAVAFAKEKGYIH